MMRDGKFDYDIGIIGGGAAGLTVAAGAAQLGAKSLLVERETSLGGDCLHYGCVPSKTLIRSAHVYHLMKQAQTFGLPEVELPPVDFQKIAQRIQSVVATIQHHDSEERFCGLGAKVMFGKAVFTDEHSIDLEGRQFTAKNWVIATGSSPAIPPIKGLREITFLTNRELFSLSRLPVSLTILGAGPIGIEMAQAFNRLGCKVTVVDRADQILIKEDKDLADAVQAVMMEEGVTFHLEASIEAAAEKTAGKEVAIIDSFGEKRVLESEEILVAMGRSPNTKDLGLKAAGVSFDKTGISVDSRLRTSQKHIFAAGDVTGRFQFTHAAGYEGGVVVSNAVFHLPRKTDYTFLPWCTYSDPELASIGMNEKTAQANDIETTVWTEAFQDNDRSQAEGERIGKIKMILNESEKPVGVQILGPRAGDLLCEWVAILNGKVKLSSLASAVHPYPTLGEISKRVAGTYFSPKIFSTTVQKGLKLFFNLKGRACSLQDWDG
jgi:pyruvate/2-oxoglutarate dehydrogenase complex dihydrolipoamide dehydrogenase (E3) component